MRDRAYGGVDGRNDWLDAVLLPAWPRTAGGRGRYWDGIFREAELPGDRSGTYLAWLDRFGR